MHVNEIVGKWLKSYRKEHGLTLDEIADVSHRYGTNWSNVTIMTIERGGGKADSLPVLLTLLSTLNYLTAERLKLRDVFDHYDIHHDEIELNDGYMVDLDQLLSSVSGDKVDISDPMEGVVVSTVNATAAEIRLARKMNVDSEELHEACIALYGHSLDDEAANRAGDGASPQKRGRVTRVLEGELLEYMQQHA